MNLDEDKVPSTLDEAVEMIVAALQPDELEYIRQSPEQKVMGLAHHGVGRYIRNGWSLWEKDTPLSLWFAQQGITHGDDKSGIIITSVIRHIRGEPRDLEGQVRRYQEHWKREIGRPIP